MLKRLKIKFVCINMLIVTIMLCIILGMVYYFTCRSLEEESIRMLQTTADSLRMDMPGGGLGAGPEEMPQKSGLPCFVVRMNEKGELLVEDEGNFDVSDETYLKEIVDSALSGKEQEGVLEKYNLRFCLRNTPMVQYILFADISGEKSTLRGLVRSCIMIGIFSFLIFLVLNLFLARWAVKPVSEAWTRQRQFIADASHELKTPLTVILTNAELLQDSDGTGQARFSENILVMARQMRGLVEGMLELARVDDGAVKMTMEPVDFSDLVRDSILPFEPLYYENGLELDYRIEENIIVNGSKNHLIQVVEILLDNAMKYSASETRADVTLKKQGMHCVLTVTNIGNTLLPEDLKHIFRRFYRIDKVRNQNGGFGLGVSIAESIVREHDGRIWAASSGGVNSFYVQLPQVTDKKGYLMKRE